MRNEPTRIDPTQLEPVREFWARPIGRHSAALESVLSVLRSAPVAGKHCLICVLPHREWALGRLSGVRGIPPARIDGPRFTSIDDAERYIFRLRWEAETGCTLPDDAELRAEVESKHVLF